MSRRSPPPPGGRARAAPRESAPPYPSIVFFLYDEEEPAGPGHPLWDAPLPSGPGPAWAAGAAVTVGEYFEAAARYLSRDRCGPLRSALGSRAGAVRKVAVRLEKHGAFYHPAHVTVDAGSGRFHGALNVAVSAVGRARIETEVAALGRLAGGPVGGDIPRVFHHGAARTPRGARLGLFLAEWFEGYSEFHLSVRPSTGRMGVRIWDAGAGHGFLGAPAAAEVFRGAARILSRSYDAGTGEHIRAWHHAAGDFVVRPGREGVDVKLITVREYAAGDPPDFGDLEPAAARLLRRLLFFLELGLRIRIDRLDGTGDWAWAGRGCLAGAVAGFFEGLPPGEASGFRSWAAGFDRDALLSMLAAIVGGWHPEAPERPLVVRRLARHARDLEALLRR